MKICVSKLCRLVGIGLLSFAAHSVQADIVLTINAPKVQASTVQGITTENFDEFSTGIYTTLNSSIGTYNSLGMAIVNANLVGGAGGNGKYFAIGNESGTQTATLSLKNDAGYFGVWFGSADIRNVMQLYENSTLEYTLDTPGLLGFINQQTNAKDYFGNPNSGLDPLEAFAYINFFGTNGTVFNKIVFTNTALDSGFESDNHSVGAATPPTGGVVTPEPGSLALLVSGGLTGSVWLLRRRRK